MTAKYRTATEAEKSKLETLWFSLVSGFNEAAAKAICADIAARYEEPHRAYHNTGHLAELFEYWDEYKDRMDDPDAVALALFFHDVIYKVPSATNEEDSAVYAAKKMRELGFDDSKIERVASLVRMTATHECDHDDGDAALMLDMDMAVLGGVWDDYKRYFDAVKDEYVPPYDEENFCKGRLAMYTQPWLEKERFFITDEFENRYAAQVRSNLQQEKKLLKAMLPKQA